MAFFFLSLKLIPIILICLFSFERFNKYLLNLSSEGKKIKIIGINFKDKKNNTINFLEELGNPYNFVGMDLKGKLSILFGIYGIPESILIDSNLIIIKKFVGPINQTQYNEILKLIK